MRFIEPPEKGTPGYERVIQRGCGYEQSQQDSDGDCGHSYPWNCDNCPILNELSAETGAIT